MFLSSLKKLLIHALLCLISSSAFALEESITYDTATESYIYRYRGYDIHVDGRKVDLGIVEGIFTPAKIVPLLSSSFQIDRDWKIAYHYVLANDKIAKQAINHFVFSGIPNPLIELNENNKESSNNLKSNLYTPPSWKGVFYSGEVDWISDINNIGLLPGERLSGFGYASFDLPGIVQARLAGEGTSTGFSDSNSGPDETSPLREQDDLITHEDYKPYPVASPMVAVPTPFDAVAVLVNIRAQVATWPNFRTGGYNGNVPSDKKFFLLDAAFAEQLDRYLASAADAFRLNQPQTGKQQIETLRALIKKEQPNLGQDEEHESSESQGNDDGKKALINR